MRYNCEIYQYAGIPVSIKIFPGLRSWTPDSGDPTRGSPPDPLRSLQKAAFDQGCLGMGAAGFDSEYLG